MASSRNIAAASAGTDVQLTNVLLDVYSQEIIFKAQPTMRFESVAQKKTELGVTPGKTLTFLRYNSLTGKSAIAETAVIETQSLSTSTSSITVTEHAAAVRMSEFLMRTAITSVLDDASHSLGMHYAKNRDALCRDALLANAGATVLYSQAGPASTTRATLTTASVFNVNLIRDAVEALATAKAPKYGMDAYICFVHPHQARYLRADSAWVNAQNYATPENILTGEIGRIEDVRFIETTMVPYIKKTTQDIWADGVDTTDNTAVAAVAATDVYQAIIVGDYCLGMAEALPVELRDNGVEDFGRTHSLAYYGIWGAGIIEGQNSCILETA